MEQSCLPKLNNKFGNMGYTCLNIRTPPSVWYPVRKFERKENNKKNTGIRDDIP